MAITIPDVLAYLALQPIKDNPTPVRGVACIEASNTKQSLSTVVTSMVPQQALKWRT